MISTCKNCRRRFRHERAGAQVCSPACRTAIYRKRKVPAPRPVWCGRTATLAGDRLALAEAAAQAIGAYDGRVTLRQVFYRLVAANRIPNTDRDYKRLGEILKAAREDGLVAWDAMEDRGRSIEAARTWANPREARATLRAAYDEDRWATQGRRVAVIVEKAALAGVIEPVCRRWQVPFIAARGYASATIIAEASIRIRDHLVLYLGDHDPSGADMTRDWSDRLDAFQAGCAVHRIALTPEQIQAHKLPPQPVKGGDARAAGYRREHGDGVWELDALPPDILGALVEQHICREIDRTAWATRDAEIERARSLL